MKSSLLEDLSKDILKDVELGECKAWSFTNSRGDTIYGRYYLPPHFDANRKYPMIVNYYGGCSPVSRNFESRYPHHAYAALGYVVYVIDLAVLPVSDRNFLPATSIQLGKGWHRIS